MVRRIVLVSYRLVGVFTRSNQALPMLVRMFTISPTPMVPLLKIIESGVSDRSRGPTVALAGGPWVQHEQIGSFAILPSSMWVVTDGFSGAVFAF